MPTSHRLPAAGAAARPRARPCARRWKGLGEVMRRASSSRRCTPPTPNRTPTSTKLAAEQAQARGDHRRLGQRRRPPDGDRRRCAAPAGMGREDRRISPAAKSAASRCAGCCSQSPTCCCWTNRPTTSMPKAWSGWNNSCSASPAPWSRSPTTATSWTTPPSGYWNSTAATASRGRATTSTWLEQKEQRLEQRRSDGSGAQQGHQAGTRVGARRHQGPPGEEQEPPRALRRTVATNIRSATRLGDLHPGGRAPWRQGDRVQKREQGLRRPHADRRTVVRHSARRDRRHHRPERCGQDDTVPHDRRQGEARRGRGRDRPDA